MVSVVPGAAYATITVIKKALDSGAVYLPESSPSVWCPFGFIFTLSPYTFTPNISGILNAQEQKLPTWFRILVHATSKLTVEPIKFVVQMGITF